MKSFRFILSICSAILTFSCSENPFAASPSTQHSIDYKISEQDILHYLNLYHNIHLTKSDINQRIIPVLNDGDTVMFIVNYDAGWELLSADARMPRVLAMSEVGNLDSIESLCSNPAQTDYIENLKDKITSLNDINEDIIMADDNWSDVSMVNESTDTWTDWYLTGVQLYRTDTMHDQDHLMLTKWNQTYPWNTKTPYMNSNMNNHCYTGCTIVAACQVLYYLQDFFNISVPIYGSCTCNAYIPDGAQFIQLNSSNVIFDESTVSDTYWDLMPLSFSSSSNHTYTATLMTHMGYLLGAKYKTTGTSAATYGIYDAYRNEFGIDCEKKYFSEIDEDLLIEQIVENKLPCILEMWNTNNEGHVVVLDGFRQIRRVYIYHYQKHNNQAEVIKREVSVSEYSNYVAINWGWGGSNDIDSSGATIWYNLGASWDTYNDFQEFICNFSLLAN